MIFLSSEKELVFYFRISISFETMFSGWLGIHAWVLLLLSLLFFSLFLTVFGMSLGFPLCGLKISDRIFVQI